MIFSLFLLLGASSLAAAQTQPAPITTGNNPDIKYRATLKKQDSTPIHGSISGHGHNNGSGLVFNINFTGFPVDGGPYLYHIHEFAVPSDGNCTGTGAHLDPYNRGEDPPCDDHNPSSCQVGDLSGKHGKPVSGHYELKYNEYYVSNMAGSNAFFGDKSVVIHNANKTRLTCANFTLVEEKVAGNASATTATGASKATGTAVVSQISDGQPQSPSATTAAPSPKSTIVTGEAAAVKLSGIAALALGGVAFLL